MGAEIHLRKHAKGQVYLGNIKWVKDAIAGENLAHFEEMVHLFHAYGEKYGFPYSLLAAQVFLSRVRPQPETE